MEKVHVCLQKETCKGSNYNNKAINNPDCNHYHKTNHNKIYNSENYNNNHNDYRSPNNHNSNARHPDDHNLLA